MHRVAASCILTIVCGVTVRAQEPPPETGLVVDLRIGGLVSIQPEGYSGRGGPYLSNSLSGTVPGFSLALGFSAARPLLAVELSSTTDLEALQGGRLVEGGGPVLARIRDTQLSVLPGLRFQTRRASVETKAGLSVLFGTPQREGRQYEDRGGVLVLTTGLDAVVRIGDRLAIVPHFRYSFANRHNDDALYYGLGNHIVRIGVAARFRLTR